MNKRAVAVLWLGVALVFALSILITESGCSKYAASWRILSAVKHAGVTTEKILGEGAKAKHKVCAKGREWILEANCEGKLDCLERLHEARVKYSACVGDWPKAIKYWEQIIKPVLKTALTAATTSLVIAEKAKTKPDILDMVKIGVCALLKIPSMYKAILGARIIQIESMIKPLAGFLKCKP